MDQFLYWRGPSWYMALCFCTCWHKCPPRKGSCCWLFSSRSYHSLKQLPVCHRAAKPTSDGGSQYALHHTPLTGGQCSRATSVGGHKPTLCKIHTTHTCLSSCPTCQRYDDKHVWSAIILHVLSSFTQHQKIFSIKTTDDSQKHFSVGLRSSLTQRCSYTFWPLESSVS